MAKKLFGNNIEVSCKYCNNATITENGEICKLNKSIKNGKCRKFIYNPIMRVPFTPISNMKYSKEDFKI